MPEDTTNAARWSELLREAATRPGLLLQAYSHFHNYSIGNQVLALVQCQQRGLRPGPIATFPTWKERGRYVRKGERALTLCMPLTVKSRAAAEGEPETFVRFVFKPRWFVLAQTEGEAFEPERSPAWDKARALAALDIQEIPFDLTDGNTQGFARRRTVSVSPLAALLHKTLFHELAHVTLGHTIEADFNDSERTPRDLREAEAEAVALILCETLSLSGADYCRGYIQNWLGEGREIPERNSQKIFHAADTILRAGQPERSAEG